MIETLEKLNEEIKAKKLEEITKEVTKCSDAAAISQLLKSNGIEVSADCAEKVYKIFNKSGELTDDELSEVSAGAVVEVNNFTCPNCGGRTMGTDIYGCQKEISLVMNYIDGSFDCSGHYYKTYKCPVCNSTYYWYCNDGYWVD